MRIAFTANGPGEVAGWLRPLLRALYGYRPDLEAIVVLVPDDYATGFEAAMIREAFPQARVVEPKQYLKYALGGGGGEMPRSADAVVYLGGDLLHVARLHARLKGRAATYKFSRSRYRTLFDRAFAVDARNAAELERWGTPPERIETVGNLAIDGALFEAALEPEPDAPEDGILFMPGTRPYEVENLIPFYFATALRIRRERPSLPMALGISPFTPRERVREAIERGGHPRMYGLAGRLVREGECEYLVTDGNDARIPVLYRTLAAAKRARLVLTIPGTKTIELAALGKPMIAMTPLNAPEVVAINGPLTYLNRIPMVGIPLKRAVAVGVSRRFRYHTQPNIDAQTMLIREEHGTVTPGRIARIALQSYDDAAWLQSTSAALAALYRDHAGAADRMAGALLELAG
jgi:hypothetical protein